ncbi:ABC transporter permease [Candidatus Amarolinea dominans]|uniref:ABC transporter permease n=1 Tax=Candidatus Amarolinea dominans TaxID=3140696 RepID=UPI001DAB606E|nr:ABC transporter permease [Anaerolineae bacterium]MBK7199276.1 ABC transporter permease [Anaerolineae bacterium]MBK9230646.1 ABC transporter permease [Anaerolineae bacterium]
MNNWTVRLPSPLVQRLGKAGWFLRRDFIIELSYKLSFLLQLVGIFLNVFMFYFLARLVDGERQPSLDAYNGDYFAFVLIGVAFSLYFTIAISGFAKNLRDAQITGTLEAMLLTPTDLPTIIISSCLWDYLFTTLRVFIYLLLGTLVFGADLGNANYLGALVVLVLTIVAFSGLGIMAASFIMVTKRGDPVTTIVGGVGLLLGGVYYPVELLPSWLQFFAALIPVTYALRAMRNALLADASWSVLLPDIGALIVFCLILVPFSLFTFKQAVRWAKIDGSLAHY